MLHDWRQFDRVELTFHRRLTVLTGANAAGKTTLLNLLGSHFGWPTQFVGTPRKKQRGGALSFLSGLWGRRDKADTPGMASVGSISYTTGGTCTLHVPEELGAAAFNVQYSNQEAIQGLFLPSHRPSFVYQSIAQIPTALQTREEILNLYLGEVRTRYTGGHTGYTPAYRLKEALISLATFGYGNQAVAPNPQAIEIYEGFVDVLRSVLPPTLGFENLSIRMPEVVLETKSGDFSFDAVSGGVAAIIDLAFQVYMRGDAAEPFVVIIDEPENHLHPELQRSLLPGFLRAFPGAQFIVATHNPFIVGSVEDSNVYVLRYGEPEAIDEPSRGRVGARVSSVLLDTVNKAGTSNQILRDVLGLDATVPLWVERQIEELTRRYVGKELSSDAVQALRSEMSRLGLADVFPQALDRILSGDQAS